MFVTSRAMMCMLLIYLLVQTTESSWLKKTAKKLENSAKKRISEGIAIAIKGSSRRRRSVAEEDAIPSRVEVDKLFLTESAQEQV